MGKRSTLILMMLPCLMFLLIFSYAPLMGWAIAFFDYIPGLGIARSEFIGFKNFIGIIKEPEIVNVLRNTFALSFLGILVTPVPALFAILLGEIGSSKFRKFVQTTTTLPYFISWILVYSLASVFFGADKGIITGILRFFTDKPTNILADVNLVWPTQTGIALWKSLGFSSIVYLASILSIDPGLYDAAYVDGANRFRAAIHVTIPGILPTYVVLLVLGIGNMLSNGFEQYYVFYNPVVHNRIQVLDYYLWRVGFTTNDFSFSTALGVTKTIVSIILLFTANTIVKHVRGSSVI